MAIDVERVFASDIEQFFFALVHESDGSVSIVWIAMFLSFIRLRETFDAMSKRTKKTRRTNARERDREKRLVSARSEIVVSMMIVLFLSNHSRVDQDKPVEVVVD